MIWTTGALFSTLHSTTAKDTEPAAPLVTPTTPSTPDVAADPPGAGPTGLSSVAQRPLPVLRVAAPDEPPPVMLGLGFAVLNARRDGARGAKWSRCCSSAAARP